MGHIWSLAINCLPGFRLYFSELKSNPLTFKETLRNFKGIAK